MENVGIGGKPRQPILHVLDVAAEHTVEVVRGPDETTDGKGTAADGKSAGVAVCGKAADGVSGREQADGGADEDRCKQAQPEVE